MFRSLQTSAFRSIQLASALSAVARRGTEVIDDVYPHEIPTLPGPPPASAGEVRRTTRAATLQGIDVPALVRCAERADIVIELCVRPRQVLQEHGLWR
jgi:uncharacterized membrane protein